LPSAESATLLPKRPFVPSSEPPVSFGPCWVQVDPERVNTHAAPTCLPAVSSLMPPIRAVFPSAESATPMPNWPSPCSPPPVSFGPCWVQVDPERVNTHAAPSIGLPCGSSPIPPISTVLPSAEIATLVPASLPGPVSSLGTSLLPC